jgi:hypothetical protein
MSMYRCVCIVVLLALANEHRVFGQSEQLPKTVDTNAPSKPQIALRCKFFELNDNQATRTALAELTGRKTESDSAEPTDRSQNEIEIVHSTEQLTRLLEDLCKLSNGKLHSETQMVLSPGVKTRYQHGEEMDFTKRPPKLIRMLEMSDTFESDGSSADTARNGSNRLVGTTILATGTIEANQTVKLNMVTKYTAMDNDTKIQFAGLKSQSAVVNAVLDENQSLIIGPWQSHREVVRTEKIPVLSSLPAVGSAFGRKTTALQSIIVFVVATPEIIQP